MASFGSAQKQLLQTNQLNVIGSVKKSYDISGLEEFLANEGAIPFIELARQYIIQSNQVSSGEMSDLTFNITTSGTKTILDVGYEKSNPASEYYDFQNAGVKGLKAGNSSKGYSFKTPFPSTGMVQAFLRWKKLAGATTSNVKQTYKQLEEKRVKIRSEKEQAAYTAAYLTKKYGIKGSHFFDKSKEQVFNDKFKQAMVKAVGKDLLMQIKQMKENGNHNN